MERVSFIILHFSVPDTNLHAFSAYAKPLDCEWGLVWQQSGMGQ